MYWSGPVGPFWSENYTQPQCYSALITCARRRSNQSPPWPLHNFIRSNKKRLSVVKLFLRGAYIRIYTVIYLMFSSLCVHSFVRLLVWGIKNEHFIGRRNDVTANIAALAMCMCLTASCLLDTPLFSVCVSQARCALGQKFTVIVCCEGTALAISAWVFLFCYLSTLAVSVLGC